MGSPADLTLGRPCNWAKLGGGVTDQLERVCKLEQYLTALEDERKKIEAFKRELPYCMQLLSDEIEASKEQLTDCLQPPLKSSLEGDPVSAKRRPILEEFIPLKSTARSSSCEDMEETTPCNYSSVVGKLNGAVQAKFWSQAEAYAHGQEIVSSMTDKPFKRRDSFCTSEEQASKPILNSQRRVGGAFLPFSRDRKPSYLADLTELPSPTFRDGEVSPSAELGRPSTSTENEGANGQPHHPTKEVQNAPAVSTNNSSGQGAPQRKPRRCWSPDLHRRFVNALQQLGGSEVATPKQIRELMKVEGLTNDEVKSHLQKYRLHTRRPNSGFHSAAPHAPQLVVLGGIWVPAHAAAAAVNQATPALYNSSQQDTPMFHQPPFAEDHYGQLNASTTQLQMHSSLYYDEQHGAATHSQGSSQGPVHLTGHSSDVGREESLGEDGNEGSSRKAGYQEDRLHESEDNGDNYAGSLHAHRWRYARDTSGEEDSEAEDGRVYETVV